MNKDKIVFLEFLWVFFCLECAKWECVTLGSFSWNNSIQFIIAVPAFLYAVKKIFKYVVLGWAVYKIYYAELKLIHAKNSIPNPVKMQKKITKKNEI